MKYLGAREMPALSNTSSSGTGRHLGVYMSQQLVATYFGSASVGGQCFASKVAMVCSMISIVLIAVSISEGSGVGWLFYNYYLFYFRWAWSSRHSASRSDRPGVASA